VVMYNQNPEQIARDQIDDNRKFTELYNVLRLSSSYIASDSQVCISTIQRLYSILKGEELEEAAEEENPYERSWQPKEPVPVADGVNVPYDVYTIETEISQQGSHIKAQEYIDKREKLSRRTRWERLDEDFEYSSKQLDKDVVNPSQIRHVIQAFKAALPTMFPDRVGSDGEIEVPKTLIFAKTDSHADDIIQVVREEFAEGNEFCKKVTYKIDEDPKSVLNRFRNSWAPRIAVTVDMIATGTDVKPLEILLFMRDVKSFKYFDQMKGRGTRTISFDDLKRVTRNAGHTKTHFVIVDAVGATRSKKTDSRALERKPSASLKELLAEVPPAERSPETETELRRRAQGQLAAAAS
jgi:type I restriction enzyme, R subunit